MKNLVIVLLFGACISACTEISYKEPQPKGIQPLTKIPAKLHGKYLMDKDTVYLSEKGLRGKDKDSGKEEVLYLSSDSIVLKEYKGNYFISYRDGNLWLLRIMDVKKNGDISFLAMDLVPEIKYQEEMDSLSEKEGPTKTKIGDDRERKEFLKKLSKETPVIETESHYIIDPSPRKLNSLIKKGFFKEEEGKSFLKKIN